MEKFIKKQNRINLALSKVQARIDWMSKEQDENFYGPFERLSEEKRNFWRRTIDSWNWNKWTDLKDRLENRLKDNYIDYCDWHFQEHGWVAL